MPGEILSYHNFTFYFLVHGVAQEIYEKHHKSQELTRELWERWISALRSNKTDHTVLEIGISKIVLFLG